MDPYLGIVIIFAGNFEIRSYKFCNGQILDIANNTALFSIVGTYYGGDGRTTYGLPDLRGRATVLEGQGPGLTSYALGETNGSYQAPLLSNNIPAHNHLVNAYSSSPAAAVSSPANAYFAIGPRAAGYSGVSPDYYLTNTAPNVTLNAQTVGFNAGGGSTPVPLMQPYLAITHLICVSGTFPPRPSS